MKIILNRIKVDNSVYLLLLFGLLSGHIKSLFIILIIILIHEIGHVFFFKIFNIEIESVVIYPFGGVTYINKKIHERIYKDIFISLGGILFQFVLWGLFLILYKINFIVLSTYKMFCLYNINIILFNLLPIIPLDGSKLFFSFFTKFFSYKVSYILMVSLSIVSLFLFIVYNYIYKLSDFIIYVFLFFKLYEVVIEYKYIMNKFYLERVIYDHYYDKIINNCVDISNLRIDKYYYFKENNRYVSEKDYILKKRY